MGHLEEAPQASGLSYCLPHHCVFKDSTRTKLRVVFDASSKFTNGYTPNDCLLLGPRCVRHPHAFAYTNPHAFAYTNMPRRQMRQRCTDKWH